jgi:hypothetical protein
MTLRAQAALNCLESLFERLPGLGLLAETYQLLRQAKAMEMNGPVEGPRRTDFDRLFRKALRRTVETLLDAASRWDEQQAVGTETFTLALRGIGNSFLELWSEHSRMLRLSTLEMLSGDEEWHQLADFVKAFGRGLFTAHFMNRANLRGILQQGVGIWLDTMRERAADDGTEELLDGIADGRLDRPQVRRWIEIVLNVVDENYEVYVDYNTTTAQSAYGENLAVLIDFLRTKVQYDRIAWGIRPHALAHEVLCRRGHHAIAERWRQSIADSLQARADELLAELSRKEEEHALQLRTVRDRLEERFVQPLLIDRVCTLVEPAARDAGSGAGESSAAFRQLEAELQPFLQQPTGVGLEVPRWLHKLEKEAERTRDRLERPSPIAEVSPILSYDDLQEQLVRWNSGLTAPGAE